MKENNAWRIYNFVNDWKSGKFGEVSLQTALDNHFDDSNVDDGKCCICGEPLQGDGNNPWPVKDDGECCDKCNYAYVLPKRIENVISKVRK